LTIYSIISEETNDAMPLLANKTAERDIRAYLSQSGFSGRTARFEELELAAIERPGWVQIFRFRVRARRSEHVIERILRHCGLWEGPLRTLASARGPPGRTPQVPEPRCDLELVLDPEFMAAESEFMAAELGQSGTHRSRELQLVLEVRIPVRPTSEPDRRGLF
jgi:hypothetical protein